MTMREHWPPSDLDLAAELRVQLDESQARGGVLEREVTLLKEQVRQRELDQQALNAEIENLRSALLDEASTAAEAGEATEKSQSFWYASWTNANRRIADLMLKIAKLEGWAREHGAEAEKLQRERDAAREEVGALTRRLADTERDFVQSVADRDDALSKLALYECDEASTEVH